MYVRHECKPVKVQASVLWAAGRDRPCELMRARASSCEVMRGHASSCEVMRAHASTLLTAGSCRASWWVGLVVRLMRSGESPASRHQAAALQWVVCELNGWCLSACLLPVDLYVSSWLALRCCSPFRLAVGWLMVFHGALCALLWCGYTVRGFPPTRPCAGDATGCVLRSVCSSSLY